VTFAFALLLSIPPLRATSALPAVSPASQSLTSHSILIAKKRKAVSFCEKQWRQCTAQCKKGPKGEQDSCTSICQFDFQWCNAFCPSGPNPC
jgi:hypothetical protein